MTDAVLYLPSGNHVGVHVRPNLRQDYGQPDADQERDHEDTHEQKHHAESPRRESVHAQALENSRVY